MSRFLIDLVVPTFNHPDYLYSALNSLQNCIYGPMREMLRIIVINNGDKGSVDQVKQMHNTILIEPGKNLGWEGGLKEGLAVSDAEFVCFMNDDVRFITGQKDTFWHLLATFNDPSVGAVGPSSNFVMGPQHIFLDDPFKFLEVKYLIGFFFLLRRKALEDAGGVDDTLPGGDDIDLSIRLRDRGWKLICRRDIFVYHHGTVTGQSVHGAYWNSDKMREATELALIRKHGMLKFWQTMVRGYLDFKPFTTRNYTINDEEGKYCASWVSGDAVLELGCGGKKTVDNAVGIDLIGADGFVPHVDEQVNRSVADIKADASTDLPVPEESQDTIIARHILEHCQDPMATISVWSKALRRNGRLIVAVPNQALGNTILMNPEHLHAFNPASLGNILKVCGFVELDKRENTNGTSMVLVYAKVGQPPAILSSPSESVLPHGARLEVAA